MTLMNTFFNDLWNTHNNIEKIFRNMYGENEERSYGSFPVDVIERENEFLIKGEIPGVNEDDIQINVEKSYLIIEAEKKETIGEKEKYALNELEYGLIKRIFRLPDNIDIDKINAEYKEGILYVTLPKKEEAKPKEIKVKKA